MPDRGWEMPQRAASAWSPYSGRAVFGPAENSMPEATAKLESDPLQKLDAAVIAPRPTRRFRAAAFQAYVLGASAVFIVLAVVAHFVAYFPIDLVVTHAVQSYHGVAFDRLMYGLSWLGFMPQVDILAAVTIALLFAVGLKW